MKHIVVIVLLLSSCLMSKESEQVKYKSEGEHCQYYLDVPKNYKCFRIETGEEESAIHYLYGDSSLIYISKFKYVPNHENIARLGDSIQNLRFQNEALIRQINQTLGKNKFPLWPDKTELCGLNSKSLFWKDIKVGSISIGYNNVPAEKKALFDKCLRTLRVQHGLTTKKLLM